MSIVESRIILCTGGARSGKSEFAERLVLSLPGQKGYVATGQIFDDEWKIASENIKHGAVIYGIILRFLMT